ncbi:MAG: hypothetical protein HFH38_02760 [Lachnospiraceae bacterium]|jgi:acyl carrier protein|nr:hypothetical protein [Lachnospiraceae bacterium]
MKEKQRDSILEEIIYLLKEIQPVGEFGEGTMLFEGGLIDSFVIFDRLLPGLEEKYGISVKPLELLPEHFETPGAIAEYIEGKIQER